jgi:glycosyltransferase involved in cell wall biosynthesis
MTTIPSYLQSLEAALSGTPATTSTALPSFLTAASATASANPTTTASDGKLKFLLVGTHAHQFTGYSKVTYGFLKLLAKQSFLSITHFGFQKHPNLPPNYRPYPPTIRVIDAADVERKAAPPGSPPQPGFGFNILPDVIRQEAPNVVLIYNDMAVVSRFLEEIRKSGIPRSFKLWVYIDQVYTTQLQSHLDILNRDADRVFTFTPFWKKCLKDQNITRPIDVLGHGFEKDVFVNQDRLEIRKKLGLPQDGFILMSLNRNQPRKRYDVLLMAFVELLVKYPTKPIFLMCVCDKGEKGGWWLFELFARELKLRGVPVERYGNRLMLSAQDMTFRDEDINMFYNLADIGISTADGEGWGLCNFEQMGVGIPQVVPDIGGFKEYCNKDNSVLIKPSYRLTIPTAQSPVGGEAELCDPHAVCMGIEEYLLDSDKRKRHGEAAKKKVLEYTWEKATENLVKRLKEEMEELKESASS